MNVFNPENIQPGDTVQLIRNDPDETLERPMIVVSVSGKNNNKVYCAELGQEFYASCFRKLNTAPKPQPKEKIEIEYYVRHNYGTRCEYIIDPGQRKIIQQLTGKKTLNPITRELLRDLTNSIITFTEVTLPY